MTSLHYAAIEGHTEIACLLISEGADINSEDNVVSTLVYIYRYVYMMYQYHY